MQPSGNRGTNPNSRKLTRRNIRNRRESICASRSSFHLLVGDWLDPELVVLLHRDAVLVEDNLLFKGLGDHVLVVGLQVAEDGQDGVLVDFGLDRKSVV